MSYDRGSVPLWAERAELLPLGLWLLAGADLFEGGNAAEGCRVVRDCLLASGFGALVHHRETSLLGDFQVERTLGVGEVLPERG